MNVLRQNKNKAWRLRWRALGVVVPLAAGLLVAGAFGGVSPLGLTSSGGTRASSAAPVAPSRTAASNYLVTFSHGTSSSTQARAIAAAGAKLISSIAPLAMDTIKVPAGSKRDVLAALRANGKVVGIALNRNRQSEGSVDPGYADQWNLPQIGWDKVYGSANPRGSSTIAVLDTGVSGSTGDLNLGAGWSAFGTDPTVDPNGHGTAVASIAAATAGDGIGVAGVDFANVTILPVQVLNSNGLGLDSDIVQGIVWAADHGANVISMSFSNPGYSQALQDAINYAWSKGAVVVAATGNGASDSPTYPAGDADVMGVAGTDQSDQPWSSSNTGQDTFIAAPATNIPADATDGSERSITGTSASAAEVAGAAALILANDPSATNAIVDGRLAESADAVGTSDLTGNGRLNVARAFADTSTHGVTPVGAPGGGPIVGPYVSAPGPATCTWTGATSTAWNVTTNWSGCGTGTGTPAGTPGAADTANIPGGLTTYPSVNSSIATGTVVVDSAGSGATLTVSAGASFNMAKLTVNANGTFAETGGAVTFSVANDTTINGTLNVSGGTYSTPAGKGITGTGTFQQSAGTVTLGTVANQGGADFHPSGPVQLSGGTLVLNHDFGVNPATLTATGGTVEWTAGTVAGGGSFATAGTFNFYNIQIDAGADPNMKQGGSAVIKVAGTWNFNGTPKSSFGIPAGKTWTAGSLVEAGTQRAAGSYGNGCSSCTSDPTYFPSGSSGTLNVAVGGADATHSTLTPTSSSITANGTATQVLTVQAKDASGNNLTVGGSTVTITQQSGTGSISSVTDNGNGTYTATVTAPTATGSGVFIATLGGNPVKSGSGSQTQATVNYVPGPATQLVFGQQPTSALSKATISPAVTVKVEDAFGNVETSDSSTSVSLAISHNGGTFAAGTLFPGGATTDSGGIATFSNLSIDNVGTGYTLAASATSLTGATSSAFDITVRAITVTAQTNSKTYDATTSATATPTVTSGAVAPADAPNFSETYDTKNVGTSKTLTPSGSVSDGNGSHNYSITFANNTTGVITARAITVTAAANSKTYDATTSAAAAPTITSGALQGSDTANFSETYDTKNVGTGKTLTPSGTASDGNSGNNYSYTFVASTNGTITARPLQITAQTNMKTYDATTSAAATPSITSGTLQGTDSANFSETYDTKNVGTTKTLTPSGTVSDGNSGNNYSYTFVSANTGTITARALTVTAQTNTKTYDATTSAAATPQITSGTLQGSDTANFSETYGTKNVGTGKTLTPSGTVNDGNSGNNYSYTFVNDTTGVINQRALTVTAQTNTKTYDATTSAAATPNITSGALQGSDTANFSETYDTKNVGTGKTLTPSGTVTDGDSGNNYTYTFVASTNGTITARALTVTAAANSKTYDATTSAATAPTITSGALQGSDTANFSETYDTKNVGSGKTLTPSGTVTDGNGGNNYSYTFVSANTGVITARALTVTAAANSKTYDATTSAAATPTITSGALQGSDTANFSETYDTKNVGTGKTLTPSGTVSDGNSGNNYSYTFVAGTNGTITARALTVTAQTNTKTYDATTSAAATPSITSGALQGSDTANFSETYGTKNAGTGKMLTPSGTVNDGNGGANYSYTFVNDTTGVINQRALTVTAQTNAKTYDATTSAAATPSITSGTLQGSDTANFSEAYANANVGAGKTLIPSGTVSDGNGGANYSYTFVNDTTGVISQRALTVTAQTNTKTYDSTTSAAATPSITSGTLQGSDTANFSEAYANANAGTGKTLIPSGTVSDGNSGNNYSYTFVNDTTGVINQRALTVTAAANTKTYDATTSAAATPSITSGTLQGTDSANFSETYGTKNVGTGKTLTPSGTVNDGNSGNNYSYNFVSANTGTITARAITVTAAANSKTYDANTSAATAPNVSGIQGTDSANFSETYDTKNVGTGKTLTASGTVNDGNSGNNYTYTFVSQNNGTITARPLTVTAQTNTKTYDANTSAAASPTITSGTLQGSDTANFSEAYANANAGTGKTLIPSGTVSDGNSGNNYSYTFVNDTTGVINQRALTVTAAANTKTYDATTSAAATPSITSGTLQGTDSANFSETYDTKNVGTTKTLTPSGTVSDGNSGNNYSYTFVSANTGTITARALTVTAQTNTKTYDSTTSAAATPSITSGALQGSDTANFSETYGTKNVGTGKTLTPSGTVNDGNSGNNYSYTFVNDTTGVINQRALTVTAQTNTKTYDATTSAAATPSITSGALQGSDTANFSETYGTKNVGTGKTLTPSGTVSDGNSGNNYSYTFVNDTTGVINQRALTVTAQTNTKTYDSTTSAAATPSITSGALQGSDSANFSETYGTKDVGTGKTLIPSGTVSDGNSGNNYSYTFVNDTTGVINQRALTVTAQTNTKTYDSTTSAAATPSITSGTLQGTDSANFSEVYANANAGSGKTLIPSGTVSDGNSGNNYSYTFVNDTTGVINQRALTVTAQTNTKTYDSTTSAAATPGITSGTLQGSDTANFSETYGTKDVGTGKTLTPSGTVNDGNSGNNYSYTFVNDTTGVINQRALTVTAAANTKTYDANTSAAATPTITSGALQGSDSANFSEIYANANAGPGKTLIPSGTVTDGNGGANYSYSFVNSTNGVINQRALTVTANNRSKTYGNSLSLGSTAFTTSGNEAGSEHVTSVTLTSTSGNDASTTAPVGTYSGDIVPSAATGSNGFLASNYNITYANGDLSITKRALTVTAGGQSKTYGTSLALGTSAFTTSGNEAGSEHVTSVTLTSTSGNDASTTAPVGTYSGDIIPSAATGSGGFLASNYNITYANGDLSITKRALTVTASGQSKTYGTSLALGTSAFATSGNEANSEHVTSVTLTSTSGNDASTTAPVGTYSGDIVPSAATGSNGFLASNYNITYANGDLTITKASFATTSSVVINGQPTVGTKSTITNGVYSPTTTSRSYQWELCDSSGNSCSNIGGATSNSYTPLSTDVGSTLKVIETVSRANYYDGGSTSIASSAVIKGSFATTTAVAINGTPTVGTATTLTAGSYSPTPTSVSYQWRLCNSAGASCSNIGGATSSSYTPVAGDAGSTLRVVETVSKSGYNDGGSTSNASATVVLAPIATNTPVAINGTPTVATASTINPGTYTPSPTASSYQWERCDSSGASCSNIGGATSTTYTPVAGDVGSTLRVVETVTKSGYANGGSTSAASPVVVKASFSTTTAVSVSGTPTVGTATTLTAGSYTPSPASSSDQWELCNSSGGSCSDIGGATSSSYTPVAGDVGSTLRVVETVSKAGYNDGTSTSAASPVVIKASFTTTTAVAINGTPTVGTATTLTAGSYSPSPTSSSYQWELCDSSGNSCSNIGGATSNMYTPVSGDIGSTLRVVETASKAGYNDGSSTSSAVAVKGVMSTTTAVAINGTPTVGTQSTTTGGTYSPSPTGRSYQWERCDTSGNSCVAISGATYNTYTPVAADAGKTLRVVETVTKSLYVSGGSTSAASALVAKGTFVMNTKVAIFGYPKHGVTSSITQGSYTPTPTARTYQWLRCSGTTIASCVTISGATAKTYKPGSADIGNRLRVVETVSAPGYNNLSVTSDASTKVT